MGNKFMEMSEKNTSQGQVPNKKSAAERLKELKELLDLGAITKEEFSEKKTSILDEL